MSTITIERPVTLTRGLLQVNKEADNLWICSAVLYGSKVKYVPSQLTDAEVDGLFQSFHLPKIAGTKTHAVVEFIDEYPAEKLAEFGIVRTLLSNLLCSIS